MVEALEFAQIYNDIGCRSKGPLKKDKEKKKFSLKRKVFKTVKGGRRVSESFRRQGGCWNKKSCPRKPKNQSKMAKKYQYEKACKGKPVL